MKKVLYISSLVVSVAAIALGWMYWPQISSYSHAFTEDFSEEKNHSHSHADTHEHSHKHGHSHSHGDSDEHGHDHGHDHGEGFVHLSADQAEAHGIHLQSAQQGELNILLSTRGKVILHPDRLAHILPKVSGVAREATKNIGDRVTAGDLLAVLESKEMADMKANYLAALEQEKLASSLFERESLLQEKKISSQQDFLNARSTYQGAKINLLLARQKLHAFGMHDNEVEELAHENRPDLRLYRICCPIDGVVINRHITRGEFIEETMTIYEIADLSTVWVDIGIYPKDLPKVREGQLVTVSFPDGSIQAQAKIIYLSPIIHDETITANAIAELDNSGGTWRPGTFVKVDIDIDKMSAPIVIPVTAVQTLEGVETVFINSPHGFQARSIHTGKSDNEFMEVLSGLNEGEKYASTNTFLLKAELGKESVEHEH